MKALRDYQQELYLKTRDALAKHRSICIQLHTGAGKTAIQAAILRSVYEKEKRGWVVVPRRELIRQASEHLKRWSVPHGIIAANMQESRAYLIHIVSHNTLVRRLKNIKNFPDIILIDEAHLATLKHKEIIEYLPSSCKIVGWTATPERLSGEGLSTESGGPYDILIEGPSIPELTEKGFLCPIRYFSPPLDGLDKIKVNKFGEFDEETLEELLQRRRVYGDLVSHWEKWGHDRSTLIFCRSIQSAKHAAERFRDKGYNFVAVDGTMPDREINSILDKHRNGKIQGICNCLLITLGVNIERVEYIGDISPTLSTSMYCQKIGRGLRPFPGKRDLIYMDHVNQILNHQNPDYPGIPLHYAPEIKWNFDGKERRKRNKNINNVVLCQYKDFLYCENPHCQNCADNPDKSKTDVRRPMVVVPAQLEEIKKPVSFAERPYEERREIQDRIGALVLDYKQTMSPGAVGELLKIADDLGYSVFWVYHRLTDEGRHTVNVTLLHEIARQKGWKPGWVFFAMKKVKYHKKTENEFREVM